MLLILLINCSKYNDSGVFQEMPIEEVKCSHPNSPYEATLDVKIEDERKWENINMEISQGDYNWKTDLQTTDQYVWWTKMQLYELNCYNPFETEIYYESW